jgi:hypothetical protein
MILETESVVKQKATDWTCHKVASHSGKLSRHCYDADVKFCIDYLGICEISQSDTLTFDDSVYVGFWDINPLNAELNPICHLLILLGDLTFMGPCIVSIFQYITNKMQR